MIPICILSSGRDGLSIHHTSRTELKGGANNTVDRYNTLNRIINFFLKANIYRHTKVQQVWGISSVTNILRNRPHLAALWKGMTPPKLPVIQFPQARKRHRKRGKGGPQQPRPQQPQGARAAQPTPQCHGAHHPLSCQCACPQFHSRPLSTRDIGVQYDPPLEPYSAEEVMLHYRTFPVNLVDL